MTKGHTPFGYRIQNGIAVVCHDEARRLKLIYKGYLSRLGYIDAAEQVGLHLSHGSVKRLLQNRHYIGESFILPSSTGKCLMLQSGEDADAVPC